MLCWRRPGEDHFRSVRLFEVAVIRFDEEAWRPALAALIAVAVIRSAGPGLILIDVFLILIPCPHLLKMVADFVARNCSDRGW